MFSTKKGIVVILIMTIAVLAFGQNMEYENHGTMTVGGGSYLRHNWVQLPNGDNYVRCTTNGVSTNVELYAGWTLTFNGVTNPCMAEDDGTIYCAVSQYDATTIGGVTYPDPPNNESRVILVKISSSGSVLDSWITSDHGFELKNIATNGSEIALVGHADPSLEHLSSPIGGGVVLIHDGNNWDPTKGFYIETPANGFRPVVTDVQFLSNGNLALSGEWTGGTLSFGGLSRSPIGGEDMFRGEISTAGVGISVVNSGGLSGDFDNISITNANGDYMITGLYCSSTSLTTFYNADESVGGTIDVHPVGNSHDQMYFAFYDASGVLQNVEYVYNSNEDLRNVDVACSDGYFYAMISNENGGTVVTPTESHSQLAPIMLKFDSVGTPIWSKQYEGTSAQYGEEILVSGDIVTICGLEYGTSDLDFDVNNVVNVSNTSYWARYFDGVVVGPTADFVGTPTTIVEGESVSFTDLSGTGTNPITSRYWTFGDDGTSSSTNPTNTYDDPGIYTVSLTVSDGDLSDTETKTAYITVIAQTLSLTPTSEDVTAAAGSTSFTVSSNGGWNAEEACGWATIAPASGNGNGSIAVNYQENTTTVSRSCVVTVTADNGLEEVFTLTQAGATPVLVFDPTTTNVSTVAGNAVSVLSTNEASASLVISGSGAAVNPTTVVTGDTNVTVSYPANLDMATRSFVVTATSSPHGLVETFTVDQTGVDAFIVLTPDNANVPASAGSVNVTIDCPGDLAWTIDGLADWITVDELTGTGPQDILISYEENEEETPRSDDFTVAGSGETAMFSLSQVAANAPLSGTATASPDEISVGAEIQLSAQGTGGTGNYSYSWTSVPVGFTSTEQSPTATPVIHTTYSCDIFDGEDAFVAEVDVIVHPLPVVDFYADDVTPTVGQVVQFTADITFPSGALGVSTYEWDFDDPTGENGGFSNEENPGYAFAEDGSHDVKLTIWLTDGTVTWEQKIDYITITVGVDDEHVTPVTTSLSNYPNPFNPTTTIRLQANANVEWKSLGVYNIKGQLVKSIDVDRLRGTQNIEIKMDENASGVYFMRATTYDGKNMLHKISLLK